MQLACIIIFRFRVNCASMKQKYAVIDIETTGGMPKRDRITEIAVVLFDGEKIINSFQSLVNPERSIPSQITRITGITNDMVADAPRFYEIAKDIIDITEAAIFVAHNVRFDYNFIVSEFKSLGYTYTRRKLCTVRLSRKAFPGLPSYSLGNLIKHFSINVESRHRAYDDAYAASVLLEKALQIPTTQKELKSLVSESLSLTGLPTKLTIEDVSKLPMSCGVYYFLDDEGKILYIGKSINIYKRVKQHFSGKGRKAEKLYQSVAKIDYELTGSELVSLLLESREIKKHQPPINRIQKQSEYPFVLTVDIDKSGYKSYSIKRREKVSEPLAFYSSQKAAHHHIEFLSEQYDLCLKVNGIDKMPHACFKFNIEKCFGACIGQEPPFQYNQRFDSSIDSARKLFNENLIILDAGRNPAEKALILVEDGHYRGYGYIDEETSISDHDVLKNYIKKDIFNPEADMILRAFINNNKQIDIIQI